MKKTAICAMVFILLSLTGCSDREVTKYHFYYEAENEDWKAGLPYDATYVFYTDKDGTLRHKQEVNSDLVVSYIGDEENLSDLKKLEISYKSIASEGKLSTEYDDSRQKDLSFVFNNAAGSAILEKDSVITVTINMDGVIQTLELVDD